MSSAPTTWQCSAWRSARTCCTGSSRDWRWPTPRRGCGAIWLPLTLQRDAPDALTNWDVTSDSLAAWLALRLGARGVVLVKSCPVPAQATPAELAAAGIVDRAFPGYAEQCARAGIACSVLTRTDIDRAIS